MLFYVKNFSSETARKPSIHKALTHFCVIITRASILLTIPVAFIYSVLLITFCRGAGVQWTPLQSRSTDRGGSRDSASSTVHSFLQPLRAVGDASPYNYENQNIVSRRFWRHSVGETPFWRTNSR